MSNLLFYISQGTFDVENHMFEVEQPKDYKPKRSKKGSDKIEVK